MKVRYVDYGNTEVVDTSQVFELRSKMLLDTPPQVSVPPPHGRGRG